MNDPDGPFQDPIHDRYHLFVQYETPRQWAHAVSDDMLRWRQLPQALQTDAWYDRGGVFSGSTTVLDDHARTPVISYSVSSNDMQALALPCNRSDPDLVQWCKSDANPIIHSKTSPWGGTAPLGRDDSTAWRSDDGSKWRMVYGAFEVGRGAAIAYESKDFKTWVPIDPNTSGGVFGSGHVLYSNGPKGEGAEMWEMPDFWRVPKASNTAAVTHVLDAVLAGRCYYLLGTYNDSAVRFQPAYNTSASMGHISQQFDYDPHYSACRTFMDHRTGRQILTADVYEERSGVTPHGGAWGWATVQSIPRSLVLEETEIGPRLRTEPIAELDSLRVPGSHNQMSSSILAPNASLTLNATGASYELRLVFKLPAKLPSRQPWRCGVRVLSLEQPDGRPSSFVEVGLSSNDQDWPGGVSRWMPKTDFGGGDLAGGGCNPNRKANYSDPRECQAACDDNPECSVWTWVTGNGPLVTPRCCLKGCCPQPSASSYCTSGVKDPAHYRPDWPQSAGKLQVYADTTRTAHSGVVPSVHGGEVYLKQGCSAGDPVELRVFVDRSIITSFVNNGTAAVTTRAYAPLLNVTAIQKYTSAVFNDGQTQCELLSAETWQMQEIFPPRNGGFRYPAD